MSGCDRADGWLCFCGRHRKQKRLYNLKTSRRSWSPFVSWNNCSKSVFGAESGDTSKRMTLSLIAISDKLLASTNHGLQPCFSKVTINAVLIDDKDSNAFDESRQFIDTMSVVASYNARPVSRTSELVVTTSTGGIDGVDSALVGV